MKKTLKTTAIFSLALGFLLCIVGLLCANVAPKAFAAVRTDTSVTAEDFEGCENWEEKEIEDRRAPIANRYFKVKLSDLKSSVESFELLESPGFGTQLNILAPGYEDGEPDAVSVKIIQNDETVELVYVFKDGAIYFYVPEVKIESGEGTGKRFFDSTTDGFYHIEEDMIAMESKIFEVIPSVGSTNDTEKKPTLGDWIDGLGEKASNFISTYTGVTISGGIIVLAVIVILVISFKRKR